MRRNVWQTWILKLTINKNFYLECHLISLNSIRTPLCDLTRPPKQVSSLQLAAILVHSPLDIHRLLLMMLMLVCVHSKDVKNATACVCSARDKHEAIDCTIRVFFVAFSSPPSRETFPSPLLSLECRCKIIIYMDLVQEKAKRRVMDTLHVLAASLGDSYQIISWFFCALIETWFN